MLVEQRILEVEEVTSLSNIEVVIIEETRTISLIVDVTTVDGESVRTEVSF